MEKARELRRKHADWDFIRRQPARIRLALEYYIETGVSRLASKLCGLKLEEFIRLSKRADVLTTS